MVPEGFVALGEDVFGNQIGTTSDASASWLWNHEDGGMEDLLVDVVALVRLAASDGIDWIDTYSDGSLSVARNRLPIALDRHLHWRTPLVLGGEVSVQNTVVVEREAHLAGHLELWRTIRGFPDGTEIRTE